MNFVLAEYEEVRAEIVVRTRENQRMTVAGLTFAGAVFAIAGLALEAMSATFLSFAVVACVASVSAMLLVALYRQIVQSRYMIYRMGAYLAWVGQKVEHLQSVQSVVPLFGWERRKHLARRAVDGSLEESVLQFVAGSSSVRHGQVTGKTEDRLVKRLFEDSSLNCMVAVLLLSALGAAITSASLLLRSLSVPASNSSLDSLSVQVSNSSSDSLSVQVSNSSLDSLPVQALDPSLHSLGSSTPGEFLGCFVLLGFAMIVLVVGFEMWRVGWLQNGKHERDFEEHTRDLAESPSPI